MSNGIRRYADVAGEDVIHHLYQLAAPLRGSRVVHINSTRVGGGVAEILNKLVPLMEELGIETHWEVISGPEIFYHCTKAFHNGLQGDAVTLSDEMLGAYEEANSAFAEKHRPLLEDADIVIVHDPQPAPLIERIGGRKGKWVWRCHIDVSRPHRPVWKQLRTKVSLYDASIFSMADFSQSLPHPQYLISPSIDPLSEKNMPLEPTEVQAVFDRFNLDPQRPMILQVSRFDRFKDPVGVIRAYRMATKFIPSLQLVLAGGEASDDPEGQAVLDEVRAAAGSDPDIHVLLLPADAHRTVNALQRASDVVLQKSIREGFGLTVAEAMWKGKPVIGGNTGGIVLQVINHHTGFLVDTPEGAALRIRYLLHNRARLDEMGRKAKRFVRENFLLTRHLREYLTLMLALTHGDGGRITLS